MTQAFLVYIFNKILNCFRFWNEEQLPTTLVGFISWMVICRLSALQTEALHGNISHQNLVIYNYISIITHHIIYEQRSNIFTDFLFGWIQALCSQAHNPFIYTVYIWFSDLLNFTYIHTRLRRTPCCSLHTNHSIISSSCL